MSRNLKYFLIPLLFGMPVWWGTNVLQERLTGFFYWMEMAGNPHLLASQESQLSFQNHIRELKPLRNKNIADLEIEAKSAISVLVDNNGKKIVLFEKEKDAELPIASLTKLMTAKIILENYDLNQIIKISRKAAELPGNGADKLKIGQSFKIIDLLYPAMMESNNTAVQSLSEVIGEEKFIELMNSNAKKLGMENTVFMNPTGLDQLEQHSTAMDIFKLTENLLKEKSFIWNIFSLAEFNLYSAQGEFVYTATSTNKLLKEVPLIVGGKTGETPQAKGCLLLVTEAPMGQGYLINIILNSDDRFEEMKKLIEWDKNAYIW